MSPSDPPRPRRSSMTLTAQLRAARLGAGLTQAALAQRLGITVGTVARWEGGSVDIPSSQLVRVAEAGGLRVALVPHSESPAGCLHRLLVGGDATTTDAKCADCGAVARWPVEGECNGSIRNTCTWPLCFDAGCAGPLGDGAPAVWKVPDAE